MKKEGLRSISKWIPETQEHEIRQYQKRLVRKVHYKLKPISEEDLKALKASLPDFVKSKPLKKVIPNSYVEGDVFVFECPSKPTIYYDVRKGTIKTPTKDWNAFNMPVKNNQAHFVARQVKDCGEDLEINYIEIHYLPRKLRHRHRANWNLWES